MNMTNHREMMSRWPSIAQFSHDLGIKVEHARVIKSRGSLPKEHWEVAAAAGRRRKIAGVTVMDWLNPERET